jgi:Uma2 family endonuclease
MRDRKKVCLENGSQEFWIVDLDLREIEVSTRDGRSIIYKAGQQIPLLFGGNVAVDAIFA